MHDHRNLVMLAAIVMYLDTWPFTPNGPGTELTPDQREDRKIAHKIREELELAEFGKVSQCPCCECWPPRKS